MKLEPTHLDALRELMNIGVGRAASELNELLQSPIALKIPKVAAFPATELREHLGDGAETQISAVQLPFEGSLAGRAVLGFPTDSATKLVELLTGSELDHAELDSLRAGVLTEVGNIVLNGVMGTFSNVLDANLDYHMPDYFEDSAHRVLGGERDATAYTVLLANTHFTVEALAIHGSIDVVFRVEAFDQLLKAIDTISDGAAA